MSLKIACFFAGAGGLDLGFELAGFQAIWANEFDKNIHATYQKNFPNVTLNKKSITYLTGDDIPDVFGFVGGPPCQSWSEGGSARGLDDKRGKVFLDYVRLVKEKSPEFFLAENVPGILFDKHGEAFENILKSFSSLGYNVSYGVLNAADYSVPQDRKRVIIVGYKTKYNIFFSEPKKHINKITLKDSIYDIRNSAKATKNNMPNKKLKVQNHEYFTGGFSSIYMSRNRVREWDSQSFTIQAGARQCPIHPNAKKMEKFGEDDFRFNEESKNKYRRFSVREIARIQTFPDNFIFEYSRVSDGYKMIGNAVPVNLAKAIAEQILFDLKNASVMKKPNKTGKIKKFN